MDDAHNHLQDARFAGGQERLIEAARNAGVRRMVVNGSCEADWPEVAELARRHPAMVIPAFGYHPWYVHERTPDWQEALRHWLDSTPGATVGEIGLDRWILEQTPARRARYAPALAQVAPASWEAQVEVFLWQWQLATERNLPVSVHCLDAFGILEDLLRHRSRPTAGFLLHSYGGPRELVQPFVRLGAYFSYPGYFAHERKERRRATFQAVPIERLLVETDAPDQLPPPALIRHPLTGPDGIPVNHPANLPAILENLAALRGCDRATLEGILSANFQRLFGRTEGGNGGPK